MRRSDEPKEGKDTMEVDQVSESRWYLLVKRLGYETYYWYREITTAFLSGMEEAGWLP